MKTPTAGRGEKDKNRVHGDHLADGRVLTDPTALQVLGPLTGRPWKGSEGWMLTFRAPSPTKDTGNGACLELGNDGKAEVCCACLTVTVHAFPRCWLWTQVIDPGFCCLPASR